MPTTTVRLATADDVAIVVEFNSILAVESEGITLDPAILTAGVAAVLADPVKGLYFLALDGDEIIGQVGLTYEYSDWRGGWWWWIQSVYVRPEYRRQGVFRALYAHVESQAKADPTVYGLRLYVEHGNVSARDTYSRLGMKQTGYLVMEKGPP